ncbi:hypothetical protein AS034_18905 [[Bacillus] enclensis]|uniref:Uncharacterized protein n=1 Tax=[Bacillus] enclensis TaxID=1402860 RepID=A0A0V8H9F8_9BACI|nr:DUF1129 family protein [[Bacillus] enclensis]KSU59030.1 hypothetical protein AS034_18905 [[Bacillus] enclensis]SCC31611.1 Protein of unknown function [[Bacillus] enclensis]
MLSKKSEQFLIELRMHLMSKGKNDSEINEITEELEDHLLQAEAEGKDVTHIVGESPKQYMKSIGESMKTDYRQIMGLVPLFLLLLAAYFSLGPAIEGKFSLTGGMILIISIGSIIGTLIYGALLFKVLPKYFHSKWSYVLLIGTMFISTGIGVAVLLWYNTQDFQPVFTATPLQNNLILAACIVIFIAAAIYTKTWFTIIIPLFLSLGPIASRFIPEDVNEDPTMILFTIILLAVVSVIAIFVLIRRKKKQKQPTL